MATLASTFVLPGGLNTYIPQLQADLIVEVSRNPSSFPLVQAIETKVVNKERGDFVVMQNNTQGMVINQTDTVWADGGDRPLWLSGTPPFKFSQWTTTRRNEPNVIGNLAIEQAAWDVIGQATRFLAQKLMTGRVYRAYQTLTTSANWPAANYATATTLGGGPWNTATSTNPYIRKTLGAAQIVIDKATYGTVGPGELYAVCNPNTALEMGTSNEFLDFIKQNPEAVKIWQADKQYRLYGLPSQLFGIELIVDNTSYNSGPPGDIVTNSFCFPDNYMVLLSKKKAISGGQAAFSTYCIFAYKDMEIETFNDPKHRRTEIHVSEDVDTTNGLIAPFAGFLISINT